eukprot:859643-Alexandrium_andersonii.AAC.1
MKASANSALAAEAGGGLAHALQVGQATTTSGSRSGAASGTLARVRMQRMVAAWGKPAVGCSTGGGDGPGRAP